VQILRIAVRNSYAEENPADGQSNSVRRSLNFHDDSSPEKIRKGSQSSDINVVKLSPILREYLNLKTRRQSPPTPHMPKTPLSFGYKANAKTVSGGFEIPIDDTPSTARRRRTETLIFDIPKPKSPQYPQRQL
jgi:hypothetical protein